MCEQGFTQNSSGHSWASHFLSVSCADGNSYSMDTVYHRRRYEMLFKKPKFYFILSGETKTAAKNYTFNLLS